MPTFSPGRTFFPIAAIALTLSLGSGSARAQQAGSTLPPTQPTANSLPAPIAAGSVPATNKTHRAQVIFSDGMLEVRADDSSLLQILHDISRKTGMAVDGGVADQHIFGNYGPAAPATVLATLLDGTGTNMLLRESTNDTPEQLVLTQRNGGPTPPNPNAAGFDDPPPDEQGPPIPPGQPPPAIGFRGRAQQLQNFNQQPAQNSNQQPLNPPPSTVTQGPQPIAQPANNPLGDPANHTPSASDLNTTNSVPIDSVPTPSTAAPAPQGIVDTPNPPPAGSTSNANGTATTPEQIYQQLLQLQQARAAAAAQQPAPATTTPTPPAPTPTPSPATAPQ